MRLWSECIDKMITQKFVSNPDAKLPLWFSWNQGFLTFLLESNYPAVSAPSYTAKPISPHPIESPLDKELRWHSTAG